jgi:hypothetical protein
MSEHPGFTPVEAHLPSLDEGRRIGRRAAERTGAIGAIRDGLRRHLAPLHLRDERRPLEAEETRRLLVALRLP